MMPCTVLSAIVGVVPDIPAVQPVGVIISRLLPAVTWILLESLRSIACINPGESSRCSGQVINPSYYLTMCASEVIGWDPGLCEGDHSDQTTKGNPTQ